MPSYLFLFLSFFSFCSFGQDAMYDICPINVSESIPETIVYDQSGNEVNLKSRIGEKPVIVVFYRGGWCPYCTRHLSALGQVKDSIDKLGFELIAITPDDFTKLDSSVSRSGTSDYSLFSDKNANAINAFGIGWEVSPELYKKYKTKYNLDIEWWSSASHHILPVPAVFIIKSGIIRFKHVDPNYRQRLPPEVLLAYLNSLS